MPERAADPWHTGLPYLVLFVVPLASAVAGIVLTEAYWPIYAGYMNETFGFDYDPSYAYLFNGLAVATLNAPGYADHPGTTSFVLIAAYLRLFEMARAMWTGETRSVIELVIEHPESSLRAIAVCNFLVFAGCLYILGISALRAVGKVSIAVVAQAIPVLFAELVRPGIIGAEATATILAVPLLALFLAEWSLYRSQASDRGLWIAFAIGATVGALVVTKITFAPVALLVFSLMTRRRVALGVAGVVVGVAVCLLPIVTRLPDMLNWFLLLSTHTGQYGSGSAGLVDVHAVLGSAPRLFLRYHLVIGILLVSVVLAAWDARRVSDRLRANWRVRFVAVAIVTVLFQTAIVLKHFSFHYFLPSVVVAALLLQLWLFAAASTRQQTRRVAAIAAACIVAYAVWFSALRWSDLPGSAAQVPVLEERAHYVEALTALKEQHAGALWIGAYRVREEGYAINFGLGYAGPGLSQLIMDRYPGPHFVNYNRWISQFWADGHWLAPSSKEFADLTSSGRDVFLLLPTDVSVDGLGLQFTVEAVLPDGTRVLRMLPQT